MSACSMTRTGRVEVWKVSSTPDDPSRAIADGVEEGMAPRRRRCRAPTSRYFGHGTTVATNALIQHRGVPTGLITTRRASATCWRSAGRSGPTSTTCRPTSRRRWCRATCAWKCRSACATTARSSRRWTRTRCAPPRGGCAQAGVEAVAVCFLYGFIRPEHEQRARARILREEMPGRLRQRCATRSRRNSASSSGCRPRW